MSEQHTVEPWSIGTPPPNGEQTIGDERGLMVAVATAGYGVDSEANARRIVAAVNACTGIPLDWLESGMAGCLQNVRTERDELRAEVEQLRQQKNRMWFELAESQAREQKLRETLESITWSGPLEWVHEQAAEALALPFGDTALKELLKAEREPLATAIEIAAEQIRKCDYTPARSTLLVAIRNMGDE